MQWEDKNLEAQKRQILFRVLPGVGNEKTYDVLREHRMYKVLRAHLL